MAARHSMGSATGMAGRRRGTRALGVVFLATLVAALVGGPVAAGGDTAAPAAPVRPQALDLAPILGVDGTFLGTPGVTGTVDASAWALVSDLAAGEPPRFAPAASRRSSAGSGPWSALGSDGAGNGAIKFYVFAIAVAGTDIYVGGEFQNVGGDGTADHVARWNGSSWSALGSNGSGNGAIGARVWGLAFAAGDLYVVGDFKNAAGLARADHVARFRDGNWHALGSNGSGDGALDKSASAVAVSGSHVYVGGQFTDVGGDLQADYIAEWDGNGWSPLGSNGPGIGALNSSVLTLAVSGTDIYVGGYFKNAAGLLTADRVAKWDGSQWSALGSNGSGDGVLNDSVLALAVSGPDVYVGGNFTDVAGDPTADLIAKWDGSEWSALGSDGSHDGALVFNIAGVRAIAVSGSDVLVAGHFLNAAGDPMADYIADWDGSTWSALGTNGAGGASLDNVTLALAVDGGQLLVGGSFRNAGGIVEADAIARWSLNGPVVRRPDGRIRLGTGAFVGNDVYNTTGAGQSMTGSAARGRTITFGISIQNDGAPGRFKVKATGTAASGYAVRYFKGATDITAAVVDGTYQTASLARGATALITAKVAVKATAAAGSKVTRLVTITSVGSGPRKDAVKFTGKRS